MSYSATPWTGVYQASLSMKFSRQECWEWVTISFSRGIFPTQGLNPCLLNCRQILYHWATREANYVNANITENMINVINTVVCYICGEGNGTLLQYSCLENPMDGGAWWAAVYGVSQSQTWLKRPSSSSSSMLYMQVVKRINLENSYHKEKDFFLFEYVGDDGCSLSFLWKWFHGVCKSNHCAIYLKLVQCYISIISLKLKERCNIKVSHYDLYCYQFIHILSLDIFNVFQTLLFDT